MPGTPQQQSGGPALRQMPLLIVAAVTAFVTGELVRGRRRRGPVPADRGAAAPAS
ncbi:hypothetical protein P3T27_004863 [Kitasatospora sp. MAA19]|uniref:hypothetical protein n=1 Tax=Kitasatospora sp. MAA19 TaxID=3035090 RepID=UPI0024753F08|nr:hypothetical protein [Kitasatospora sp. MAA19]MDH6708126.1 hypothetical protein [Kitasatospora sp. MAA19]